MKVLTFFISIFFFILLACNSQYKPVKIDSDSITKVTIESVGFPDGDIQFDLYANDTATHTLIKLINESKLIDDANRRSFSKGKLLITFIANKDAVYCFNSPISKQNTIALEVYSECYTGWYYGALSNENFYLFFKNIFESRNSVAFP